MHPHRTAPRIITYQPSLDTAPLDYIYTGTAKKYFNLTHHMVASKKGLKIGRALRSAARLPIRVSAGRGSGRNAFLPAHGEAPVVVLRVQILSCQNLEAKDRNGFSDPCVCHHTPLYLIPWLVHTLLPSIQLRDRLCSEHTVSNTSVQAYPQSRLRSQGCNLRFPDLHVSGRQAWRARVRRLGQGYAQKGVHG